jgi:hypothetical protein
VKVFRRARGRRFAGGYKARSYHQNPAGPQGQGGHEPPAVGEAAGGDHWDAHRLCHGWHQRHGPDRPHFGRGGFLEVRAMPSCLAALRHDGIDLSGVPAGTVKARDPDGLRPAHRRQDGGQAAGEGEGLLESSFGLGRLRDSLP